MMEQNQILRVYLDTPMYFAHKGLKKKIEKDRIKSIHEGEFYIFVNKDRTAFKVITGEGGDVIVHYKSPSRSRPIDIQVLKYIPHYFGGQDAGYSKALEHSLRKRCPDLFEDEKDAKKTVRRKAA